MLSHKHEKVNLLMYVVTQTRKVNLHYVCMVTQARKVNLLMYVGSHKHEKLT